jgi:RNA polymerase sigma-70 factor (ECF subfamily)
VQQTFLSAVEGIGEFRDESSFGTWISRIAVNHALALLRKRSRRPTVSLTNNDANEEDNYADVPHPEYIAQWRETPAEIAARHETQQLLNDALDELDDKYRLVFLLRDVEGLSTEETAEALDIGISNVKIRLLRARLMLRERLTKIFGDESTRVAPAHDHDTNV